jgi:hypothetical protein
MKLNISNKFVAQPVSAQHQQYKRDVLQQSIVKPPTSKIVSEPQKSARDNHSNQLNSNNIAYWKSRGLVPNQKP